VFTAKDKLRILDALDRVAGVPGATGALLRREKNRTYAFLIQDSNRNCVSFDMIRSGPLWNLFNCG
jgi:hypothetical protein